MCYIFCPTLFRSPIYDQYWLYKRLSLSFSLPLSLSYTHPFSVSSIDIWIVICGGMGKCKCYWIWFLILRAYFMTLGEMSFNVCCKKKITYCVPFPFFSTHQTTRDEYIMIPACLNKAPLRESLKVITCLCNTNSAEQDLICKRNLIPIENPARSSRRSIQNRKFIIGQIITNGITLQKSRLNHSSHEKKGRDMC